MPDKDGSIQNWRDLQSRYAIDAQAKHDRNLIFEPGCIIRGFPGRPEQKTFDIGFLPSHLKAEFTNGCLTTSTQLTDYEKRCFRAAAWQRGVADSNTIRFETRGNTMDSDRKSQKR